MMKKVIDVVIILGLIAGAGGGYYIFVLNGDQELNIPGLGSNQSATNNTSSVDSYAVAQELIVRMRVAAETKLDFDSLENDVRLNSLKFNELPQPLPIGGIERPNPFVPF